jgi:hypothetical protein
VFIFLPQRPFGQTYRRFENRQLLTNTMQYYQSKITLLTTFSPDGTIVYANDFRHLQYYLPQYLTFSVPILNKNNPNTLKIISIKDGESRWQQRDTANAVPPGTERIVLFDLPPELLLVDPTSAEEISLTEFSIFVLPIPPDAQAIWTPKGLTLEQ